MVPFPFLDSWAHESQLGKKGTTLFWTLIQSINSLMKSLALVQQRYFHLVGTITESSKDHSIVPLSHVLWEGVEHGKINKFHISMGSLQHLLCCEVP